MYVLIYILKYVFYLIYKFYLIEFLILNEKKFLIAFINFRNISIMLHWKSNINLSLL